MIQKISYDFIDAGNTTNTITLTAEIEETQISEREMYRLNGLLKTGSAKQEDEIIDTICMHLCTYINDKKANEDAIYDFQTKLSKFVNKKYVLSKPSMFLP